MNELNIIKKKMKKYRGLFDEELLLIADIDNAKTIEELKHILDIQIEHISSIESDMLSHLSNFRRELKIDY